MKFIRVLLVLLVGILFLSANSIASDPRTSFDTQLNHLLAHLNREVQVDVDGSMHMAGLIQRQYEATPDQIKWSIDHSVSWGDTVVLAYIQFTTGRTFEKMFQDNARQDFWQYAENAGMNHDIMARSLDSFWKTAEKERNSRLFERLRVSRRVQALPDLGSGFGLFLDALDFRQLDPPRPTKVHVVTSGSAKGEQ